MVFAKPVATVVGTVLETRALSSYSLSSDGPVLPLDALAQRAVQHWPGSGLRRIYLPQPPEDGVRITLRHPEEVWRNHGARNLWLNPNNGTVLGEWTASQLPAGNRLLTWVFPLHNADDLGLWARYLWILVNLMPALLFAIGVVLWWQKRQRR